MARKTRVQYPGAIYHVMARGDGRAVIYRDREDHELFLKTLEEALERFEGVLHAWCLMPNHFHLVLETPKGNLSRMMAWLLTTFAVRYRLKNGRSGHVFQGRYRAELVEEAVYGRWLVLYVHLNPVRTRTGGGIRYKDGWKELNAWAWSSHQSWLGKDRRELKGWSRKWLTHWGTTIKAAQAAYRRAIETELGEEENERLDWKKEVSMGLVAGGEELKRKVKKMLKGKGREVGREVGEGLKREDLRKRFARVLADEDDRRNQIWIRVWILGERPVDLARELKYRSGAAAIGEILKRLEKRAEKDQGLGQKLEVWKRALNIDD